MKNTIKSTFEKHYPLLLFFIYAVPYSWSLIWYKEDWVGLSLVLIFIICILIHSIIINFKKNKNGQLLSAFYIFIFLNLQYIHYFVQSIGEIFSLKFRYPALLFIATIILLTVYLIRTNKNYRLISNITSYFILAFLLVHSSTRLVEFINIKSLYLHTNSAEDVVKTRVKPNDIDVFYLVFDSYTNSNSLKKYHNFDNSTIQKYLISKGFKVIENSRSRYTSTANCMSSVFGMDTLSVAYPWGFDMTEPAIRKANLSVSKAPLFTILDNAGIDLYSYSIFPIATSKNKKITWEIAWWSKMEHMFQGTALKYPYMKFISDGLTSDQRVEKNLYDNLSKKPKSAFYFYHFYAPHGGYVPTHVLYNKSYIKRVEHANKRMIKLVDYIFENNKRPFIIIIQGDHGSREIELENPKNQEKFTVFNAIYFPDKDYSSIQDNFNPINTFRLVLKKYFNAKIDLLDF